MAVSYGDQSFAVYSSMLGDPLYCVRDDDIEFPITGISWKPHLPSLDSSRSENDIQTLKAVSADGKILMWRPKFGNNLKTIMKSENNSYQAIDYSTTDGG